MNHRVEKNVPNDVECSVLGFFTDELSKHPAYRAVSEDNRKYIDVIALRVKTEGDMHLILLPDGETRLLLVCAGERKGWTQRKLTLLIRRITQTLKGAGIKSICVTVDDFSHGLLLEKAAEVIATNCEMAQYEFTVYRETPKEGWPAISEMVYTTREGKLSQIQRSIDSGYIIGQEVNYTRTLSNIPGGDMTPRLLADEAKKRGKECGFTVSVLGEKEMEKLGMGGILGVSRGSTEEAQLIVMQYLNGPKGKKPLAFAGKGITFDSGGLHLKPSNAMDEMHMDMSGGASVIGALSALARMEAKVNVIGIVPAAENMVSGASYRPGDVLKSMMGKTIEVVSPDAEGRVVLADALTYLERYEPSLVVDVATLTGAVVVALGHHAIGTMTPDDDLSDYMRSVGEASGDYVWPLPLWSEYEADVKGQIGDILNANRNREAGAINGGMFLYQFAKKFPKWVHCDIASTMTTFPDQALAKGASGSGTRLLIEIARTFKK